jgi:hypothetical protein
VSEPCPKCDGTTWYTPPNQRGTVHSYKCDACCKHDKGRWLLEEIFGEDNGKWGCMIGCGTLWESEK